MEVFHLVFLVIILLFFKDSNVMCGLKCNDLQLLLLNITMC